MIKGGNLLILFNRRFHLTIYYTPQHCIRKDNQWQNVNLIHP